MKKDKTTYSDDGSLIFVGKEKREKELEERRKFVVLNSHGCPSLGGGEDRANASLHRRIVCPPTGRQIESFKDSQTPRD
eukprot:scaffold781_cov132-Cylindrotheca_fusiformis.AAC.6